MGQVLHRGLLQGWEPVGAETHDNNELVEVECFSEVIEGGLVRRSWVVESEERIWKPSQDLFETVKVRIVSSDERQVTGVPEKGVWGGGDHGIAVVG